MNLNIRQDLGDSVAVRNLVIHFCSLDAKKTPDKAWMAQTEQLIDSIGRDHFLTYAIQLVKKGNALYEAYLERFANQNQPEPWMEKVYEAEKALHTQKGKYWEWQDPKYGKFYFFYQLKGRFFRGTIFSAVLYSGSTELLNEVDNFCAKFPAHSSDAIWVYAELPLETGVPRLTHLRARIKKKSVQNRIDSTLKKIGEKRKVSADQIEEMAIAHYGLNEQHQFFKGIGAYTAKYEILNSRKSKLTWIDGQGKEQSSIPKSVLTDCAYGLKLFKAQIKEIENQLSTQKERIEGFFLKNRVWAYSDWFNLYIAHPLIGVLGKQLIWQFKNGTQEAEGIWQSDRFIDANGKELDWLHSGTEVVLWHPIQASVEQVQHWRSFLINREITQAFKQAFREIYRITDAEIGTQIFSNRFANHYLNAAQFSGLCKARGWTPSTYGESEPTKRIPAWNLKVEFGAHELRFHNHLHVTGAIYLSTHQVRFFRNKQLIDLQEIPPIVFSESMRDIDLFVAVSNLVIDPAWVERPENEIQEYGRTHAFAELTETANTRKELLLQLIPKLKIASKCSFEGNFLKVQGKIRSYKIHLGSGNIMMEPNDQYLCIVEDRSKSKATEKFYLPFEGDHLLSIIVSKALLLAEDHKITDPVIIRQIKL